MTTTCIETDFLVAGGGVAGVCAALAAARQGCRVVLIQARSVLGGNSSSEIRMHIVGADAHGRKPGARETGLMEELRLEDAASNPQRSPSCWDMLLYSKVISEPNIRLLLDTTVVGAASDALEPERERPSNPALAMKTSGTRRVIRKVFARRDATEELFEISASFYADCTGDGRLGSEAGADFTEGREASDEFNESFALPARDRKRLGSSIMFMARHHDRPMPYSPPAWTRKFSKDAFCGHRDIFSYEYGYWWFEWGGQLDTIKDDEAIRHECWRIALGVWDYVKNSGDHPESENWALDWVAPISGKRESRRFLGPAILTQNDILSLDPRSDVVAYGGWPMDLHPPEGVDANEEPACTQHHFDHLFSIPYGVYHSRNVENLFFAGRNISATHVAFAATRVMATCGLGGQVIGTAAALLIKSGGQKCSKLDLPMLQATLQRNDCFLPGLPTQDSSNLVEQAMITAEGFEGADLSLLYQGSRRDLKAAWGKWSRDCEQTVKAALAPARICLEWPSGIQLGTLVVDVDTGLQRELILSGSNSASKRTIRGPQPECCRIISVRVDGHHLHMFTNNVQRHLRIDLGDLNLHKIEIEIGPTYGGEPPALYHLGAYPPGTIGL